MTYLIIYLLGIPLMAYLTIKGYEVPKDVSKIKIKYDDTVVVSLLWPLVVFMIVTIIGIMFLVIMYVLIHSLINISLNFCHVTQLFYGIFDKIVQSYVPEDKNNETTD